MKFPDLDGLGMTIWISVLISLNAYNCTIIADLC